LNISFKKKIKTHSDYSFKTSKSIYILIVCNSKEENCSIPKGIIGLVLEEGTIDFDSKSDREKSIDFEVLKL
jgi:hypothetical protein